MLYTLFVGTEKDALNKPIGAAEYRDMLNSAERETAEQFGGYTMTNVHGGWINPQNDLIREESIKFEISGEDLPEPKVLAWAKWMRRRFRQQSVMLSCMLDGSQYITD